MTAPASRATEPSPHGRGKARLVLADGVTVGGPRVPIVAPPGTGADAVYVDAAYVDPAYVDAATGSTAGIDMDGATNVTGPGVLVDLTAEPDGGSARYTAASHSGASVVVVADDAAGPDREPARESVDAPQRHTAAAARDAAVVLRLRRDSAPGDVAEAARRAGADAVLVDADDLPALEQARRHGVPVLADVDTASVAAQAAVAVVGGADGLWLSGPVTAGDVGQAREAATRLAPLVRQAVPDSVPGCREALDGVDAALATLLEHRVALAGRIQQLKPVGGYAGRDADREAAIVRAMAGRAPSLGAARLAGIVDAVIAAGLDVAEARDDGTPPVWRG
ncbi:chorismate mutase [Haloactinopolyspora alba]|uniref:Chorismate mutase n=1 Tax=Haloactinopolyspora alba TaxID=648780 RepID=A0A2P8E414_9ACTN|nr:chorismate mutase [Haloactinopolyspora alba]PSL04209.1 chorismate mutase [Haloactinopolyspora alba]